MALFDGELERGPYGDLKLPSHIRETAAPGNSLDAATPSWLASNVSQARRLGRGQRPRSRLARVLHGVVVIALSLVALRYLVAFSELGAGRGSRGVKVPLRAQEFLDKCSLLEVKAGPPPDFHKRTENDRFVVGSKATLIKNASIWTGNDNGLEVVHGDILLDKGLIKRIGHVRPAELKQYANLERIDAQGKWVSPGIVDLHSHLGVYNVPTLKGAMDVNSHKGPVLPWLRALDGLNTHDDAYKLSIAGGVTSALVLPGSANAIGGQAVVIKLRPPTDRSPTGMLLENPYETNSSVYDPHTHFRYRYMKHACGENPDRVYSGTRMDTIWAFRQAYEKARQIKQAQDDYCAKATKGEWAGLGEFPEDLQWEALVDVLRGRVKVNTHCYETVDLDDLVRITNEFKFSIAAFHHAHETYLVPDTLKSAYGHPPAVAIFATNARYKRESYRGSEFAAKILAENGLQVVMKSDHPVLNSRHLVYEAQQAHFYGLPHNLALASVTTTPATVMGQEHRIGFVKQGHDADLILWDSHPLALGATPQQVWIDGLAQLDAPHLIAKPAFLQKPPKTPNFDREAKEAVRYDGLPPLEPVPAKARTVVFANVSSVYLRQGMNVNEVYSARVDSGSLGVVLVRDGRIECVGSANSACVATAAVGRDAEHIDLEGGAVSPALVTTGSPIGLEEIRSESSTMDGTVLDPLTDKLPALLEEEGAIIRAADGLQFGTRDALIAYRSGVTTAITPPRSNGFLAGLSAAFSTGGRHKLEEGALLQEVGALHVAIHPVGTPSVSTQIAALRRLLLGGTNAESAYAIEQVQKGEIPLAVHVHSADAIASIIALKEEVEAKLNKKIKVTLVGATEAHLLAKKISEAGVGVVVSPTRPFPRNWEQRRLLPGPPLSEKSALAELLAHNVTLGVGVTEAWEARNTRFHIAWAALESDGAISKADAIALASVNVEALLGVKTDGLQQDLVATQGGELLEFSKVVAVISPRRGVVDLIRPTDGLEYQ
ncbi:carbohydrate esterase family 9 protein [Trametes coccinea BRFM310]|uniref:Carbohydrate esterase family 9 protein n=1 Tax=Trametes coccinea (strain BRFM310) TaxID=1353009 RepID=A0A1Y2IEY8_TRAC3|nr:carbohydrate esterase family 9 protein [Trametes coccinea BRFM310]